MPSFEHNKLTERIARLDIPPEDSTDYAAWCKADLHMAVLRESAAADELIIYASSRRTFIHTVVIDEENLYPLDQEDLLHWSGNPYFRCAGYDWDEDRQDVWIANNNGLSVSTTLEKARPLVFGRHIEGLQGQGRVYFEVSQEYSHLTEIHWRPELHAYCRFDEHGDWDHIVSITSQANIGDLALVSFSLPELEQYLVASNSILVRMFEFTLWRQSESPGLAEAPVRIRKESDDLFYRQRIAAGQSSYTRGVQVIRPTRPKSEIFSSITHSWTERTNRQYADFIAWDFRNRRLANISTHPSATTNYFSASDNSLPYETSPAFFRPEVLLRYKADREKYIMGDRSISCREIWELRAYDINEAGQVHVYICDLQDLPFQEQLYWKTFNEEPKSGISDRAFATDFQAEFPEGNDPLASIVLLMHRWADSDMAWWKLGDRMLLSRVSIPRTHSRDEWLQAFLDLSRLVIEGFRVRAIRKRLDAMSIEFEKEERSLALLERVLIGCRSIARGTRLNGLRTVQNIRNTASHSGSSKADELSNHALEEHGTYSAHFESVCEVVTHELDMIEKALS